MLKFIITICFFLFVVPYLLRAVLRFFIGGNSSDNTSQQKQNKGTSSRTQNRKKKVFPQEEGEYVDYVEVKN